MKTLVISLMVLIGTISALYLVIHSIIPKPTFAIEYTHPVRVVGLLDNDSTLNVTYQDMLNYNLITATYSGNWNEFSPKMGEIDTIRYVSIRYESSIIQPYHKNLILYATFSYD